MLFWANELQASNFPKVTNSDFYTEAFKSIRLDALAKLMFGMHFGGEHLRKISSDNAAVFVDRFRQQYNVPLTTVSEQGIKISYIVDVFKEGDKTKSEKSFNDQSVSLLELLRQAFPDKSVYSAQGFGHRLSSLPLPVDDTTKNIPAAGLFFEEWININVIGRQLFEYSRRANSWPQFCGLLLQWEKEVGEKIKNLVDHFNEFYKDPAKFELLIPIIRNSQYKSLSAIPEPKMLSDKLGLYYNKTGGSKERVNLVLTSRFQSFFRAYRKLRGSLLAVITQTAKIIETERMRRIDKSGSHDSQSLRMSMINILESITDYRKYISERSKYFSKFTKDQPLHLREEDLFLAAHSWKLFIAGNNDRQSRMTEKAFLAFKKMHVDFKERLASNCKIHTKKGSYTLTFAYNEELSKPILVIDGQTPTMILVGLSEVFNVLKKSVGDVDPASLRYLMLKIFYNEIWLLPLVKGESLNSTWYTVPLYAIENYNYDSISPGSLLPRDIDQTTRTALNLSEVNMEFPQLIEHKMFFENFMKVVFTVQHLIDVAKCQEDTTLDEIGEALIIKHHQTKFAQSESAFESAIRSISDLFIEFPQDPNAIELMSEKEHEYWHAVTGVWKGILPIPVDENTSDSKYHVEFTTEIISEWSARLNESIPHATVLYYLLCDRSIERV